MRIAYAITGLAMAALFVSVIVLQFAPGLVLWQDSPDFYGRVVSVGSSGVARVDLWRVSGSTGYLCNQNVQVADPSLVNGTMVYFHFARWFGSGDSIQVIDGIGTHATDLALSQGSGCVGKLT